MSSLATAISKFRLFWDLMDTIKVHGYLRSAMSVVGRSAVGAWYTIKPHDELGKKGSDLHRRKLHAFYTSPVRDWTKHPRLPDVLQQADDRRNVP